MPEAGLLAMAVALIVTCLPAQVVGLTHCEAMSIATLPLNRPVQAAELSDFLTARMLRLPEVTPAVCAGMDEKRKPLSAKTWLQFAVAPT